MTLNAFIAKWQASALKERPAALELFDDRAALPRSGLSNSPFRYPGGKFYARRLILDEIPEHEIYCEPFAGGASVFFAKRPAAFSTLNDLDTEVVNVLRTIRDRAEDLIGLLDGIPATKENHTFYKDRYVPPHAGLPVVLPQPHVL